MTVTVNAKGKHNTHHMRMSYGGTEVGLIRVGRKKDKKGEYTWAPDERGYTYNALPSSAVKIYQGDQGYADTPPPWTPMVQDDWSGGRGSKTFEKDKSKFFDSYRLNTARQGEIILGPWDNWAQMYDITNNRANWVGYWKGEKANVSYRTNAWRVASPSILRIADSFVATASCAYVWLILGYVGSPAAVTIRISGDTGGNPGTSVASTTLATTSLNNKGNAEVVRVALTAALTPGTTYWLSLEDARVSDNYWECYGAVDSAEACKIYSNSAWSASSGTGLFFRICPAEDPFKAHFYEYKGALYSALEYEDGGDSTLWLNGEQGIIKTGSTVYTGLIDDGLSSWSANDLRGTLIQMTKGTSVSQSRNWRRISNNLATSGGETTFHVYDNWSIAPAAADEFAILGSKKWTQLDTTTTQPTGGDWDALTTATVTDVLSVNHAAYFAMGDSVKVQRMRIYTSNGEWKPNWTTEDDAQFTYLGQSTDENGNWIWGGKGGYPATISKAASVDCSGTDPTKADLDFVGAGGSTTTTTINAGDVGERIRSMINYGQYGNLHVLKEGGIYSVFNDIPYKLGLTQMGVTRDFRNGAACVVHNTYLFFSYHNTVMRYNFITELMDNVGPTSDESGLPSDRLGPCVALASFENYVIGAWDGGSTNYSCIMVYNGMGWHEIYRPPAVGLRIQSLYVQSIPGDNVDRLWFSCGSDIGWLTMASDPYNFPVNNNYHHYAYALDGNLITPYIYFNQQDVYKMFSTIKGLVEKAAESSYIISVDYRLDDTTTWTSLSTDLDSFQDTISISSTYSVTGRRIQFRITPYSIYVEYTPRITALIYEALVQQKYRKYIDTVVMIADKQNDLLGNPDDIPLYTTKIGYLNTWAQQPYGVLLRDVSSELDNKYVKLDTPNTRIVDSFIFENRYYWIVQLRLYECATT